MAVARLFPKRWQARLAWTGVVVFGLLTTMGAGCLSSPDILPPPPIDPVPEKIVLPPEAVAPPEGYDHALLWDYSRLVDSDLVHCYAGESDLARDVRFRPPDDPQRSGTIALLVQTWHRSRRPEAHIRAALVRLLADLAPADPRTRAVLIAALDDDAMPVRFRANTRLCEMFSTDVSYDPNETDPAVRTAAIARWKKVVEAATPPIDAEMVDSLAAP